MKTPRHGSCLNNGWNRSVPSPGTVGMAAPARRMLIALASMMALPVSGNASTPLLDESPGFFAGEWAGNAGQGGYCYLTLSADGRGTVLIDSGTGDWLAAQILWRNRRQALEVEKITPLPAATELRVMPLSRLTLATGLNQSLKLNWGKLSNGCQLQKIETTAGQLQGARRTVEKLKRLDLSR